MNFGKTLFAQLMEFVPWTSFARIVERYSGDALVSALPSTEHFRIMAYAQLTWRESLRDIEATLGANPIKLYAMGLRQAVRRSTLADANEWFDWAPFRSTKAAIKLHTLLDLRGCISSCIHISDGKMGDVNVLDLLPMEVGAFYIMDRSYLDFARLYRMHQAGAFFVTRAKSNFNARRVYSAEVDKTTGVVCDQAVALNGFYATKDYPEHLRRVRFKDETTGKTVVFLTNNTTLPARSLPSFTRIVGRWSCSSNGSSSICESSAFWATARTR